MKLYQCRKCKKEKSIYGFDSYYDAKYNYIKRCSLTCRICKGKKPRHPLDVTPVRLNLEYDHTQLVNIITRLNNHNGMAKECDILPLVNSYASIFTGVPVFIYEEDRLSFMYNKLKEFLNSCTPTS